MNFEILSSKILKFYIVAIWENEKVGLSSEVSAGHCFPQDPLVTWSYLANG